jgi:epoxide hydrolase-like predicted phosphatase
MNKFKGVIFDLGGVVFSSPMQAFAKFESLHGLEHNFLNRMIVRNGENSAWSKLERGLLSMGSEFFSDFDKEIKEAGARNFSSKALMEEVNNSMGVNPSMLKTIELLKQEKLKVAALTNNWIEDESKEGFGEQIQEHFDIFIESAKEGLQKPDPEIYKLTLNKMKLAPEETVFLDDIGRNLKSANALGITTIKVVEPIEAIKQLSEILKLDLSEAYKQ